MIDKSRLQAETNSDIATLPQERVNIEMFKAIEALGRKLERAEGERDRLQRRLSILESGASVDDASGRLYLPVVLDPAATPATPTGVNPRWLIATSLASSAFAVFALGLVLMNPAPAPQFSSRQLAALDTLATAQSPITNVDTPNVALLTPPATLTLAEAAKTAAAPAAALAPPAVTLATKDDTVAIKNGAAAVDDNIDISKFMPAVAATPAALNPDETVALPPVVAQTESTPPGAPVQAASAEDANPPEMAEAQDMTAQQLSNIEPAAGSDTDIVKPKFGMAPAPLSLVKMLNDAGEKLNGEKMTWGVAIYSATHDTRLSPAASALEARAFKGAGEAQHDMGVLYASGDGAPQDYARATFWFKRAAASHIADAAYNLGVLNQQGLGGKASAGAARDWYIKAARLGHPAALYNLGVAYAEGSGIAADVPRALSYFKQAANAGEAQAAYNIGLIYESDAVGKPDTQKAGEWYRVAANAGDTAAKDALTRLNIADIEPAAGSIDANEHDDAAPATRLAANAAEDNDSLLRKIQQALALRGDFPPEKTNGIMTPQTADAIRDWQKKLGLAVDGQPSEELLDKIKAAPQN